MEPAPQHQRRANTLSGDSYDNTRRLDGIHWRHVKFIEQFTEDRKDGRWLLMSDVCKHCVNAPCLEVCPTGAIVRTEFDTVVIQSDACNGCRDCIAACPFGVIEVNPASGPRKNARFATIGCRAASSRPARRPVRPSRSSSAPSRTSASGRKSASINCSRWEKRERISTAPMKKCSAA